VWARWRMYALAPAFHIFTRMCSRGTRYMGKADWMRASPKDA